MPEVQGGQLKHRVPPSSREYEQCVLAAMILDPEALLKVLNILNLDGSDFYHATHKTIFKGILALHDKHEPIDPVTVVGLFEGTDTLSSMGGGSYIAVLIENLATTANVNYYARKVKEYSLRRAVINHAQELMEEAFEDVEAIELIESAQKRFTTIALPGSRTYTPMRILLKEGFEEVEAINENKGRITGLTTGFYSLDRILGGFQKTDLIILAGRPSMGKSSLCCQIATNMAIEDKKVGYFSIEVGQGQVIKNIFASQSRIDTAKFRTGGFGEKEWGKLTNVVNDLYPVTFSIDDHSYTTQDIVRQARRMYAEHGLDIIFVDHIQELREKGRHENRNQEVDLIASKLKGLAKELNIPVVAVAQLSRKVEDRGGDFIPRLSDLRDSGSLEQKADVIIFVYRAEYYFKDDAQKAKEGEAKIIIAKHRNGCIGDVELMWHKEYIRFDELYRGEI